ncbi:hypothetical protein [Mediterraneibacter faecis]|uniref:hypothetical protein n=1 Tax=Mediterraneibacter faecis TaxID=592978 RepID=UPI003F9BA64B
MTKYREILRLSSLGFSNRNIALSVPCSRNTVSKVLKRAQELKLCWPLQDNQTDEALEKLFYPKLNSRPQKRMPDYDYIFKVLTTLTHYIEEIKLFYHDVVFSEFYKYFQSNFIISRI